MTPLGSFVRAGSISVERKQGAIAWGVALAVVLLAKAPTLSTPYYWDELGWASAALWLAEGDLLRALPGAHPPATFFGHPPGLHVSLAVLFKLFGRSIIVAHLLIAGFAAVGLVFTYKLGRLLYGPAAGLLAALFLLAMPVYFAQAGMFLADLPVAAVGAASVYLVLRRRLACISHRLPAATADKPASQGRTPSGLLDIASTMPASPSVRAALICRPLHGLATEPGEKCKLGAYCACAAYLLLLKETAMALVAALALYVFLTAGGGVRERARAALACAAPLLIIGLFLVVQRVATGHWFFIISGEPVTFLEATLPDISRRAVRISRWLFIDQSRCVLVALCLLGVLFKGASWGRRELLLFLLITLMAASPFAVIYYLPRYVLPVFPYLCVASAGALVCVIPSRSGQVLLGVLLAALIRASPMIVPGSNHEWNMAYRDVIHVYRSAYASVQRALQQQAGGACVLTVWPHTVQLAHPELGYVDTPIRVVTFAPSAQEAEPICAFILSSDPGHRDQRALREYAQRHGFTLSDRVVSGEIVAEQYRRTGPVPVAGSSVRWRAASRSDRRSSCRERHGASSAGGQCAVSSRNSRTYCRTFS